MMRYSLKIMVLLVSTIICAENKREKFYNSYEEKSAVQAVNHSKTHQSLCRYLANRDLPFFISRYVHGNKAFDYGAGTGFSSQFLQDLGFDVTGADVSIEMLAQARKNCPNIPFYLIEDNTVPCESNSYDLVLSSLVLFELATEEEILSHLLEAKRVLKTDGVFIAVTGSQDMYSKDWLFFDIDYPENKNLKSGNLAKIYIRDLDMKFTNFYWTQADYCKLFKKAGFILKEVYYPLGKEDEGYQWKDEKTCSPFVIVIATIS